MTVRELIEHLMDAEPDSPVVVRSASASARVRQAYYDSKAWIITHGQPKQEDEGPGLFVITTEE